MSAHEAPLSPVVEKGLREQLELLCAQRPAEDLLLAPARASTRVPRAPAGSLFQHAASGTELVFAVEGEGQVATPNRMYQLAPGKLLVLERGVFHAELQGTGGHVMFWCHLNGTRVRVGTSVRGRQSRFHPITVVFSGRTNVESVGDAVVAELAARAWGYPRAVAGLLNYLACIIVRRVDRGELVAKRQSESPAVSGDPRRWQLVHTVLEYCSTHLQDGVTATQVARALGYSREHLSDVMRNYLGHSLADHLHDLRLAESSDLLRNSELSIGAISRAVGYADPAHFTRAFTRARGLSPRQYRREARI